jgi:alkanesulfonate monooxygenase SsuD/methylene tetrahydromethanopterin reductase-like flavin-dependent oxidoreductase (luciferase family)
VVGADDAPEKVWCEPKPLQPGGVPLWISGRLNRSVLSRLVRFGSGWIPWGEWSTDVVHGIGVIREAFAEAGRSWGGFQVRSSLEVSLDSNGGIDLDATLAAVPAQVTAGITDFSIAHGLPGRDEDEVRENLLALVQAFRSSAGRV